MDRRVQQFQICQPMGMGWINEGNVNVHVKPKLLGDVTIHKDMVSRFWGKFTNGAQRRLR